MVAPRRATEKEQQPRSLEIFQALDPLEQRGVAVGQHLELCRHELGGTKGHTKHSEAARCGWQ